jgi:hypothetical protein
MICPADLDDLKAAILLADVVGPRAVAESGMSAPPTPEAGEVHRDASRPDDWRSAFCRHRRGCLTPPGSGFIDDILRNYSTLSPKQSAWLYSIEARLRGRQR